MNKLHHHVWSRRAVLRSLGIAGSASLFGFLPQLATAEPPPETTTIRIIFDPEAPVLCYASQYVAEPFLRMEGFSDVRYVPFYGSEYSESKTLIADKADFTAELCPDWVVSIDRGDSIVVLTGLHAGCTEIFASERVRSIRELKGKRVAMAGGTEQIFISAIAAYIGLDPHRDIEWIVANPKDWTQMLAAGKVDAIITFPPMSYAVRDQNIGHVILNTTTDEPWRHYFCCMVGARREFAEHYPIATKRALRAILKANELCSLEPERTGQWLVNKGYTANYDYALSTLQDVPYKAWRDYDPDDTLRFYALRLHEVGLIKHNPQQIIEQGTDWRFLNELKQELKA